MKLLARALLLPCLLNPALVLWSTAQQPSASALDATIKRNAELHARALAAVRAEQQRASQPVCPKAQSTVDINACMTGELMTTESNETKLVRALGALLRVGTESPNTPPMRLNFDKAETTWHLYREQACSAAGEQYEGGSMRPSVELGCRITITQHHMEELWAVYDDLGTH